MFQHDNVRSIKTWFASVAANELECPAQSLEINPIEHLWDALEFWLCPRPSHKTSVLDPTIAHSHAPKYNEKLSRGSWKIKRHCKSKRRVMFSGAHTFGPIVCHNAFKLHIYTKLIWINRNMHLLHGGEPKEGGSRVELWPYNFAHTFSLDLDSTNHSAFHREFLFFSWCVCVCVRTLSHIHLHNQCCLRHLTQQWRRAERKRESYEVKHWPVTAAQSLSESFH